MTGDHLQGHYDEFRIFAGLRPCEQVSLRVHDYDGVNGILNVTKSRRANQERDRTKNGGEFRVKLCPRAIDVLERYLRLRETMVSAGLIDHDNLFVTESGAPLRRCGRMSSRWTRTISRLSIRYRRTYVARHTSVSWNLMIGRPPQWVTQQHGHSAITMFTNYAAWVRGAQPHDVELIRRAMNSPTKCATQLR